MSFGAGNLGVLGRLGTALGIFGPSGDPNPSWFGDPGASLKNMLADPDQRRALIDFVDEALSRGELTTDSNGAVWLPIVELADPALTVAITVNDTGTAGVDIGVAVSVRTAAPESESTLSVPLFRAAKKDGPTVSTPFLLGSPDGRIRLSTSITITDGPPPPNEASLGAIGLDFDVPTSPSDVKDAVFGLSLRDFQLPGATGPRTIRVAADGVDELDDALLDLVLSLVKSQADAAAEGSLIASIGGLLGLHSDDAIDDFPIAALPSEGVHAIAAWLHDVITNDAARSDWLKYLAYLIGGHHAGDTVTFGVGGTAALTLGLKVDTGPTGNTRLTPTLAVVLVDQSQNPSIPDARVEASADLFQIDLVTGTPLALPRLGVWAAAGRPGQGHRILDLANPTVARADTLRVGFALDPARRLTFVLAADGVTLGAHDYPTLDLTSPDAVMDAVGNTVSDVATELLGSLGAALGAVRLLIGLDAPNGIPAITLPALMSDPLAAVSGYWRALAAAPAAVPSVLETLRNALADASEVTSSILGSGTALDPWRVPLIGPLELEVFAAGDTLSLAIAATTSVDDLGQRCTVVETRFAATLATIDLAARKANLLPGVEALLSARERGVRPPRVTLPLGDGASLTASGVGIRLAWTPTGGLSAEVDAPDLTLTTGDLVVPIALPTIGADGKVTLPAQAWDGVQALVGYLGAQIGGFLGDVVEVFGWITSAPVAGGNSVSGARLSLSALVVDPAAALAAWLPRLALSDLGPRAFALVADLFAGSGANHGFIVGTGHPDDPYRFAIADGLPNVAIWFPPAGLEPRLVQAPEILQRWRPGDPGLGADTLAAGLRAEAEVAEDVRDLVDGRDVEGGLAAIAERWVGGDGRIVPPATDPVGITIDRRGVAAGQLVGDLDLEDLTGRVPTTTVYVALGAGAWPDAPAGRRVDLTTAGLDATMFPAPTAATGDWFVALGTRADSRGTTSTTDGTPEQAARLARVLDALASVSNDIALVGVAGAGHAARLAAQAQPAVTDLVTLGTPLGPIALTALTTQPTADGVRLLHRLLPPAPTADDGPEDDDLALGRALVGSMIELADRIDPSVDLRPPVVPQDPPRAGLTMDAVFGAVSDDQVQRAITAIVAAGLAQRAQVRAATPPPDPTGVRAGLRVAVAPTTTGAVSVSGDAILQLLAYDGTSGIDTGRALRLRLRVGDRLGWLTSTADVELRMLTADVTVPLDGAAHGTATVTLHDARVFGQSWERLILGTGPGAVPVMPEARTLLASAIQRVTADVAGPASVALAQLLTGLGIVGAGGGVVGDAVDQLIFDPGGLLRARRAAAGAAISAAVGTLVGPTAVSIDLGAGQLYAIGGSGGSDASGRFGWHADVTASPTALKGQLRFGDASPGLPRGGFAAVIDLDPFRVALQWRQPGGALDDVPLWPNPDAAAIARAIARAAPSLGGHAALEIMRHADDSVQPIIDAALDALGMLTGAIGDAERAIRPLAPLLADPAGWLRSAESLAASSGKIQALFDALRPLLGVAGAPGSPLALATGVSLSVAAAGQGARLGLDIDATAWTAPEGGAGRLAAGIGATLTVGPSGPPSVGLELNVGLTGAGAGRQAVHVRIGTTGGVEVFIRPASGADISLLPFAGLGSLAAAAEAALPFLLDKLAEIPGTPGQVVQTVGDGLALRAGMPAKFDGAKLHAWAVDPVGALVSAVPSLLQTGLTTLAPLLDDFVPAAVGVTATTNALTVKIAEFSLTWSPATGTVTLAGDGVPVPGIDQLSFTLGLAPTGLDDLIITVGPAVIDAGGATLRPFVTVAVGQNPSLGRRVAIGMAVDDTHRFAVRWLLAPSQLDFITSDGDITAPTEHTAADDPTGVALRVVEVVADLVAAVALAQDAVKDLLDTAVGTNKVGNLMRGVVLDPVADPAKLIAGLFDPATLLARLQNLFGNIAGAGITITFEGLELSFVKIDGVIGLQLGLEERLALVENDDVSIWLETDDSWIENNPAGDGGLFVGFLSAGGFKPSLTVNGVGLRVGKKDGPLLNTGISLDSIALYAFAELDPSPTAVRSGGVELQLSNLGLATSGAQGQNGIAKGIMSDTGSTPPRPAFSPALAIQKHGNGPVHVTLRAGDGDGPWWIVIQKGFGPLYIEQIGFGTKMPGGQLQRISLLLDASVSMFGLTCAVDELEITYLLTDGSFFDPKNWSVDLAGLAVGAQMAGVTIEGGLLKETSDKGIEYLGMLLGRFGTYGITIYGGYGEGVQNGQKFTSFFAVGAINGPIGGPPVFFLTGIGGGFGINRKLIVPTDLSDFGDYPLIKALDVAAKPGKPMDELRKLGVFFPMEKGTFWFAAGISFNCFALVDGIAVLAVEIGDGLDIYLLGLARLALPRPQAALVSIELGLLVHFSSSEGILWVQGQLTDNSWLLYTDVKLTGGFAYVIWFKGEHSGEFVLTLGGYHPNFHRDGYPVVPRLGLRWSVSDAIVITAGSYFALTSEALMAGGDFEASAHFGPAWAEVTFGADGIVYFDPFHYDVDAYARIAAGVTVDTWIFGEVTISINLGARIEVTGPEFHGEASFDVGPVHLSVEFGGSDKAQLQPLSADAFIAKYLAPADGGGALAHAVMVASGALPAKGEDATPDGSQAKPFVVVPEFGLTFTSTVPATSVERTQPVSGPADSQYPSSVSIGVAPMGQGNTTPAIGLTWYRDGTALPFPFGATARPFGDFPIGVWGLPQDPNNRKVPAGAMIEALNALDLAATATEAAPGPEIPYYQVEIGQRKPLPFSMRSSDVNARKSESNAVAVLVSAPSDVTAAFRAAAGYLAKTATPTALAALRGERQAPPLIGTLAERLDADALTVAPAVGSRPPGKVYDHFVDPPVVVGLMGRAAADQRTIPAARTTVNDARGAWRTARPTLASVDATRSRSIAARLVVADAAAVRAGAGTVIGAVAPPPTAVAHARPAVVARAGAPGPGKAQLDGFTAALRGGGQARVVRAAAAGRSRASAGTVGATLHAGQTAVLKLPNARADAALEGVRPGLGVTGAPARVVVLGHGGVVMVDGRAEGAAAGGGANEAIVEIGAGAERIAVLGLGAGADADGLAGWHSGMHLPYLGWSTALGPGCVVRSAGGPIRAHRERLDAGWVTGAELARGISTVTTRFSDALATVVIILDDPAAFADATGGRQLLLGLDGATRAVDGAGAERPPVLMTVENRCVLAYDVVPTADRPVVVTIASQLGWSLVGVMGSAQLTASGAIAAIAARGLDAALRPFAGAAGGDSVVRWLGPTRTPEQRRLAKAMASRRASVRTRAVRLMQAAHAASETVDAQRPDKAKPTASKTTARKATTPQAKARKARAAKAKKPTVAKKRATRKRGGR